MKLKFKHTRTCIFFNCAGSSEAAVGKHTDTPTLSDDAYSVSFDAVHGRELSAINWPKKVLIQTHG